MIETLLAGMIFFAISIVYSSFFEWTLHRYLMHRPFWKFSYSFKAHAVVHHGRFKADETYVLNNHPVEKQREDKITIPMAWWNGPVLIATASLPFVLWGIFSPSWLIIVSATLAIALYYGTYEYIHWCMHLPKERWFERTKIFKWIDGHHRLHHRHMNKNFNVVLPVADWFLDTLLLKSEVKKKQKIKWPTWTQILK